MAIRDTQVVTNPVRLSFLSVFSPWAATEGAEPKYSATLLIPKEDKDTLQRIKAAMEAARLASGRLFGGKVPEKLRLPIHDGDAEKPNGGEYGPECRGMYVINASSRMQPGLVDRRCNPITDSTELYSGCWARADISFYAYNVSGNRGIAAGLNNLQKVRDDEPLGGRARASDVFDTYTDDEDDDGLGL